MMIKRSHGYTHRDVLLLQDDSLRFSRQREHIKAVSVGPPQMNDPRLDLSEMGFPMPFSILETMIDIVGDHYPTSKQRTRTSAF